jgi:uncharacterized repeat protein (TIGR01451 family)
MPYQRLICMLTHGAHTGECAMRTRLVTAGWLSLIVLLLVPGCGGGGNGGRSGGGSGGGAGGGSSLPALQYSGNTNAAEISATNASKLFSNILGTDNTAGLIAGLKTESGSSAQGNNGGLTHLTRLLNRTFRDTLARPARTRSGSRAVSGVIPIDQTEACDSGSVRFVGDLADNGTGILTVSYNNCRIGDETLNGQGTFRVDRFDSVILEITDYTVSFPRLTLRGPGINLDISGSVRVELSFFNPQTARTTENLVILRNLAGAMIKTEDLVFIDVGDINQLSPSVTESISGRIFDSVHGFVDVSTPVPFFFADSAQGFPDSGQLIMTGNGNRAVRVMSLSPTVASISLDLDGNGVFEVNVTLKWTDVFGPIGADLADGDGDGMHNGWEIANGFNPNNSADAALDKDGDGASNLAEYQGGSDPSSATSLPPATGIMLFMHASPNPIVAGGTLTYSIVVENLSPFGANNVVVTDILPASVNLISAVPDRRSCAGTSRVTCDLGTMAAFSRASIVIQVTPMVAGLLENTASVTTISFDPHQADNTVTRTVTVGEPVTGLQAEINAAVDGQTILVGPGTYAGNLDFGGKNIVLQSTAGPSVTFIVDAVGVGAVRMGPGGAIKGFTIGGGLAGILVIGQGSLISGNIFDGNAQTPGGFAAAINGNFASPTIEGNIFRNNSCPHIQRVSGVIAFFNTSSPVIRNNVFENNQCRAVNLVLPEGNAPQVINNTFFGNLTAIRVDRLVPATAQILRNNLLVQNGIGLEAEFGTDAGNPVWQNNLVFGNTVNYQGTADQTGLNGNISQNPMFVNGAAGNYRLQPGSPAINAGSSVGAPSADFDGTARPIGGSWDIGAFEAP